MLSPPSGAVYQGERRIITSGTTIFSFYYDSDVKYKYSTDGGVTWGNSTGSSGTGLISADSNSWTVVRSGSKIYLTYSAPSPDVNEFSLLRKIGTISGNNISWGASTWLLNATQGSSCGSSICAAESSAIDPSGNVYQGFRYKSGSTWSYFVWESCVNTCERAVAIGNAGTSQKYPFVLTFFTHHPVFNQPRGMIAWATYEGGEISFRRWVNSTQTETPLGPLETTSGAGLPPNTVKVLAAHSDNSFSAYVVYLSGGTSGALKVARWDSNGNFIGFETADATLNHTLPSISVSSDGVVHIFSLVGQNIYDTRKVSGVWQTPMLLFGGLTSPNQLTSSAYHASALWTQGSAPYTVKFGTNRAPMSSAGADQNVDPNVLVTLNGTASSDPEGAGLTYQWTQTAGPSVTLSSSTSVSPTFTSPAVSS
ncbi:MAG: hypothetical protein MN733_38145, partial [Nitrososphaera sp.]|nr:hypothetical protein [Nitrososphaera sp.]